MFSAVSFVYIFLNGVSAKYQADMAKALRWESFLNFGQRSSRLKIIPIVALIFLAIQL